jgi:hypothetical protein
MKVVDASLELEAVKTQVTNVIQAFIEQATRE